MSKNERIPRSILRANQEYRTLQNNVAQLLKAYKNYKNAHKNLNNYARNHANENENYAVRKAIRNYAGIITTYERVLRRVAMNVMHRQNIPRTLRGGGYLSGQSVNVYIPQLLRRLNFKHTMNKGGVPKALINAYIKHVN